jgi:hypothetical protein
MQLSKTQITALLTEVASQEDGFNELLQMSFEALMKAERQEYLLESTADKGSLIGSAKYPRESARNTRLKV